MAAAVKTPSSPLSVLSILSIPSTRSLNLPERNLRATIAFLDLLCGRCCLQGLSCVDGTRYE